MKSLVVRYSISSMFKVFPGVHQIFSLIEINKGKWGWEGELGREKGETRRNKWDARGKRKTMKIKERKEEMYSPVKKKQIPGLEKAQKCFQNLISEMEDRKIGVLSPFFKISRVKVGINGRAGIFFSKSNNRVWNNQEWIFFLFKI